MAAWRAAVSSVAASPRAPKERTERKDERGSDSYWGLERV